MLRTLRALPARTQHLFVRSLAYQSVNSKAPQDPKPRPVEFQDDFIKKLVHEELITIPDFITEEEEQSLLSEIDPVLTRARYQAAHWDDVGSSCSRSNYSAIGHSRFP